VELIVRGARIDGHDDPVDIAVAGGRIARVEARIDEPGDVEIDAGGRLASPAFVEPHIHLDKTGTLPGLPPNPAGTLASSIENMVQAKRDATVEQIRERAGILIRRMVIAGTTAIRSHVDVDKNSGLKGLEGIALARADHADVCDIQIVAFPQLGLERPEVGPAKELMREAIAKGADVVGGIPAFEIDHEAADRHIEWCMQLAAEHDLDVDMHVDETDDPRWHTLSLLAEATNRHGWGGRVTAGHCCAMAAWDDDFAARVIRRLAEVDMNIVANPATNLVLQGREDHEPRRRGITRVKELIEAGVNVAAGLDNLHDGFYPLGSGDQLMNAWLLVHAAHLTTPDELQAALETVRSGAARVLRLDGYAIAPGGRGDIVILDAETSEEALRNQVARRWVIHSGRVVAETAHDATLHRAAPAAA
jgi:cytosine deaminase